MAIKGEVYEFVYNAGPVSCEFHADVTSRVKLLIGPMGTGKTTSASYDLIRMASQRVKAGADGIRRSRFAVIRNCYDDQTEILTRDHGWVLFRDLKEDDLVAMLDGEEVRFVRPSYYYSAPYSGEMVGFENEGLNFCVTPDHKLLVSARNAREKEWGEYRFRKAFDCFGKQNLRVSRAAGAWKGVDCCLSEEMFEWLGYWFAEGSTSSLNGRHACHVTTKNDKEYATSLFEKAGLPYSINKRSDDAVNIRLLVTHQTIDLIKKLIRCGKSTTKSIPAEWKNAPTGHLKMFIKGYLAGDGDHRSHDNTVCASTASRGLADDLQEIGLRAGYVVNINLANGIRKPTKINGVHTQQTVPTVGITFVGKSKYNPKLTASGQYPGWHKTQYDGMVYCVEVPTHVVYVRRGGRAFWCSQTYPELRDTVIRTYLDWWPPLVFGDWKMTDKQYVIRVEGCEVELLFRALDSPDDVRNLLSLELTGAHVDESREIHEDVLKGLLGRVGRFPSVRSVNGGNPFLSPPQVILTTNYPSSRHWLYRDFVSKKIEGYSIYQQKQEENKHNLAPGYYENLAKDYENRPDLLRTMVQGDWGITVRGRNVYTAEEWRRSVHVSKHSLMPTEPSLIVRGWDNTGLSPAVILTYFTASGQWLAFKEFIFQDVGIMDATEAVLQYCARELPPGCRFRDIADPAGRIRDSTKMAPADYILRRSTELGFPVRMEDGIQTFKVRREGVATRLNRMLAGEPAVLVDPACEVLIEGFDGGYCFPEIGTTGEFKSTPDKNVYSHVHDAFQYIATRVFGFEEREEDYDDRLERQRVAFSRGRSAVGGY